MSKWNNVKSDMYVTHATINFQVEKWRAFTLSLCFQININLAKWKWLPGDLQGRLFINEVHLLGLAGWGAREMLSTYRKQNIYEKPFKTLTTNNRSSDVDFIPNGMTIH